MLDLLIAETPALGVRLSVAQLSQFERYLTLLADWSKRMNLVGDADPDVVQRRHMLESIALGAALREREILKPGARVLDVGSGAGFPGLVLKIVWPGIQLTLLEATQKKTQFLGAVVEELALHDTTVLVGRAETLAHDPGLRAAFDVVTARAVAGLPALLELTLPFARIGGCVVTPKGSRAADELSQAANALKLLGARAFVLPFGVPGPPQSLVVAIKQRATDDQYPRRPGLPVKSPL
jgi:16S rRNA (guanine527-N7)-methyltransferase